jgi:hypothetical protein
MTKAQAIKKAHSLLQPGLAVAVVKKDSRLGQGYGTTIFFADQKVFVGDKFWTIGRLGNFCDVVVTVIREEVSQCKI